ncbi:unnamed protein product [Aureobasidium mustum]|uniref:ZN622/Rei1/Reh1 zinc finger C2H2-type domain-containing protein n=1 Tax=Aureobasidium mustum TaxID=2773714 RepID=A0A9N8KA88_9PEZI|nr:unnamed protein product [Aureobasidium mustum]
MATTSSATGTTGVTSQSLLKDNITLHDTADVEPEHRLHSSSSDVDDSTEASNGPEFDPAHCLFCLDISEDIDTNLDHMSKSHGMNIPSPHQLTVDPTTLLAYLNLVISVYHECLTCGTQRRNTQAIQQHMLGKKHCAFDISDVESEYREFWEFEGDSPEVDVDGDNVTLPSGRVIMSRSVRSTQQRQRSSVQHVAPLSLSYTSSLEASDLNDTSTSDQPSHKQALTRQDLRALRMDKQLGTLNSNDRLALAHLPAPQQRAILLAQRSQLQTARRQQRAMESRLQRKNNQTMMKHFVSDVPGPKLG